MIRRNPTLIAMSDIDVQQVRDAIAKRKAEAEAARIYEGDTSSIDLANSNFAPVVDTPQTKKMKDTIARHERLGLQ